MEWSRRAVMALGAGALATGPRPAFAQSYPGQDVHFICAFQAGSGSDTIVRFVAEKMRPLGYVKAANITPQG